MIITKKLTNRIFRFIELFKPYTFSAIAQISNGCLNDYLLASKKSNYTLEKTENHILLKWTDRYTYFEILFNTNEEFLYFEKEMWYAYTLYFFKKRNILEYHRQD